MFRAHIKSFVNKEDDSARGGCWHQTPGLLTPGPEGRLQGSRNCWHRSEFAQKVFYRNCGAGTSGGSHPLSPPYSFALLATDVSLGPGSNPSPKIAVRLKAGEKEKYILQSPLFLHSLILPSIIPQIDANNSCLQELHSRTGNSN